MNIKIASLLIAIFLNLVVDGFIIKTRPSFITRSCTNFMSKASEEKKAEKEIKANGSYNCLYWSLTKINQNHICCTNDDFRINKTFLITPHLRHYFFNCIKNL